VIRFARFVLILALALIPAVCRSAPSAEPVVKLNVNATDAPRTSIPRTPGHTDKTRSAHTAYPQWIPGHHRPAGPIVDLVDMRIAGEGKDLPGSVHVRISR
jgi:hypothetical protein